MLKSDWVSDTFETRRDLFACTDYRNLENTNSIVMGKVNENTVIIKQRFSQEIFHHLKIEVCWHF